MKNLVKESLFTGKFGDERELTKLDILDLNEYTESEFRMYVENYFIEKMKKNENFDQVKGEMLSIIDEILEEYKGVKFKKIISGQPFFQYSKYTKES